jgi:hypothetical protein
MTAEDWLLERLKQHGIDVYVDGEFPTLAARLGHVIVTNRYGPVVAGRHNGKPETYAQLYERIYGEPLPAVPRGTDTKLNKRAKT